MIKDFDMLKQQLAELAEAVNKFESEAVQLRVVELVLEKAPRKDIGFSEESFSHYVAAPDLSGLMRNGRLRKTKPSESARGAVAALNDLIESDFFSEPRTIGDIVSHCEEARGAQYKSNAFSGPLSRHARSGVLAREKNADGNFVYYKP
ncbi:hypothetical protein NA8A_05073 [Nitratireductor indicus C115]|uniref:Uncharacterized protein n=2 Tax=Nitratireductor indicus TaxID=721133 RepID=K2P814_9HYPH|nr:hypothetical protein NA8A_05073 [Nitratireductor indicus C115]